MPCAYAALCCRQSAGESERLRALRHRSRGQGTGVEASPEAPKSIFPDLREVRELRRLPHLQRVPGMEEDAL